jgi:hypothetical protein
MLNIIWQVLENKNSLLSMHAKPHMQKKYARWQRDVAGIG